MAQQITTRQVSLYNFFAQIRDGPGYVAQTAQQLLQAGYREIFAPLSPQPPPIVPGRGALADAGPLALQPVALVGEVEGPAQAIPTEFTNSNPQGFYGQTTTANWQGGKILGAEAYGEVTVWNYIGPPPFPSHTSIAVKQTQDYERSLETEHDVGVARRRSPHIIKVLGGHTLSAADSASESEDALWDGVMVRIFMEYLPIGSLQGLLDRRIQMQKAFKERTLWAFFKCLVDGAAAITDEDEMNTITALNPTSQAMETTYQRNRRLGNIEGVHFDFKPENIMVGPRIAQHPEAILKTGDLGLFQDVDTSPTPWNINKFNLMEALRRRGNPCRMAPEQFTENWEHLNVLDPAFGEQIAGRYSSKTNIWGIATIMYALINLIDKTPLERGGNVILWAEPYFPTFANGVPALGNSHGIELELLGDYSEHLKDSIKKCLYDYPEHRPTLEELKKWVMEGLRQATHSDPDPEPFEDFVPYYDPILVQQRATAAAATAAQNAAIATAAFNAVTQQAALGNRPPMPNAALNNTVIFCNFAGVTTAKKPLPHLCGKKFKTDGTKDRCFLHQDRNQYP